MRYELCMSMLSKLSIPLILSQVSFQKELLEKLDSSYWPFFYWKSSSKLLKMLIDLVIVTTNISLVTKEVDLVIFLEVFQTICFIPANRKNIKTYLPSNRVFQAIIMELILQSFDKGLPYVMLVIIFLKFISFFLRAISADRGYVN